MLKVLSRTNTSFVKLADIADLNPRLREKPALDTKVSFVPMAAVSSETGAIVREEIRPYGDVAKGFTVFECGDVLVAKITPCCSCAEGRIGFQVPVSLSSPGSCQV
jgi:hypothetical protein